MIGRVYVPTLDGDRNVRLQLSERALPADVVADSGVLRSTTASVRSTAVLYAIDESGDLLGTEMEPIELRDGQLCFDPSDGGVRTRENRLALGGHNFVVAEATRFGAVNTFFHLSLALDYLHSLLGDVGAPALPHLEAVVGAHSGSRVAGFGQGDGDRRKGRILPLHGGHYRLSQLTSGVPELTPVSPTGEIHLGPGRIRRPFATQSSYLRSAAHNPAIIYHEVGHHLCRFTADFCCNADRKPHRQRNGKPGIEEGISDYFAAALLRTGRAYGWFHRDGGARRDVTVRRSATSLSDLEEPHTTGAVWASFLWQCREQLVANGSLPDVTAHDRVVVRMLTLLGASSDALTTRREREAQKVHPHTIIAAYLTALREAGGSAAASIAEAAVGRMRLRDAPLTGRALEC